MVVVDSGRYKIGGLRVAVHGGCRWSDVTGGGYGLMERYYLVKGKNGEAEMGFEERARV